MTEAIKETEAIEEAKRDTGAASRFVITFKGKESGAWCAIDARRIYAVHEMGDYSVVWYGKDHCFLAGHAGDLLPRDAWAAALSSAEPA